MNPPALLNCPEWLNPEPQELLDKLAKNAEAVYRSIAKNQSAKRVITHGDLKSWHLRLFQNIVPVPYYAGNYRSADSRFPCLQVDVHVNGVSGAPFQEVPHRMEAFSTELQESIRRTDKFVAGHASEIEKAASVVQLAAFIGGSVIQIHPFRNGNGRIGRLVMSWCFNRYDYKMPFFVNRPPTVLDYEAASASAMLGDYAPLFRYLLTLMSQM